jgi:hypothetical protein
MKQLLLLAALLVPASAWGQYRTAETFVPGSVPSAINVQGSLEEQDLLVSGLRDLTFRVFTAEAGGVMLWESNVTTVNVDEGIWGTRMNIPIEVLLNTGDKWIEILVDGLAVGREKIEAVPYARIAQTVAGELEISSGALSISTASATNPALRLSSNSLQVLMGTTTFIGNEALHMVGDASSRDLVIGAHSRIGGNAGLDDVFVVGNAVIGGAITGVAFGGQFQLIGISTDINAGFPFRVGAGTFSIAQGGNVGIGVPDPQRTLDTTAATIPGWRLEHTETPQLELRRAGASVLQASAHVASSTLRTTTAINLTIETNGTERMRFEPGGDSGIGTLNPARPFDIVGVVRSTTAETGGGGNAAAPAVFVGGDSDTGIYLQAGDAVGFSSLATERIRIDNVGNTGIGAIAPGGQRLVVDGGDIIIGTPGIANTSGNPDVLIEGNLKVDGAVNQSMSALNSLQSASVAGAVGAGDLFEVGVGTFVVRESGSVGVGVTNPGADLEITATSTPGIVLNHATQPRVRLQVGGGDRVGAEHDGTIATIGTENNNSLRLVTLGTPKITIEGGGDVGVGETNPTQLLDVGGTMTIEGTLTLGAALGVASGGTAGTAPYNARVGLDMVDINGFEATANAVYPIRISSTAAEATMLEFDPVDCLVADFFPKGFSDKLVAETCTDATASLDLTEATAEARFYDTDNDLDNYSNQWTVAASGANDISFDTAGNTFVIDVSANEVGIGNTNPSQKMDVSGDINTSAKLKEGGNDLIPAGAVAWFNLASCPGGWADVAAGQGRALVGRPLGGTLGGTVGSAMADTAGNSHAHTLSNHTHGFNPDGGGHLHGLNSHTHNVNPDGAGHTHALNNHTHTSEFDGAGHNHTLSAHTHNVNPDGAGHTHNLNSHTHTVDYPATASGGPSATGTTAGGAGTYGDGTHTHTLDIGSGASGGPSTGNTASTNLGTVASAGPSTANAGTTNLSAVASGGPSASSANTNLGSVASGGPSTANMTTNNLGTATSSSISTNTTNTPSAVLPYLQLRICQKS